MTGATRNLEVLASQEDREAWGAARLDGLGGSDISAICNENPYRKAIDVFDDRMAGGTSWEGNERTLVGALLEAPILSWYACGTPTWPRRGGNRHAWRPPLVMRRDRPWHRGSADALVMDAEVARYSCETDWAAMLALPWERGAEVKTHGWHAYRARYGNPEDPIPPDKRIQVAWYADLYEIPTWDLCMLADTHQRHQLTYHHDQAFGADLLTIAEDWWLKHIVGGITPDADGSERYADHLRRKFPTSIEGPPAKASPELEEVVAELKAKRIEARAIVEEVDRLEQVIKGSMGPVDSMSTKLGNITWRSQRGRVHDSEVIDELAQRLGLSDGEVLSIKDAHRGADFRTFNVPRSFPSIKSK